MNFAVSFTINRYTESLFKKVYNITETEEQTLRSLIGNIILDYYFSNDKN